MEKILKREDGSSVLIVTDFAKYRVIPEVTIIRVEYRLKGKRKWLPVYDSNNNKYRALDWDNKAKYEYNAQLKFATSKELLNAKIELWESIKPTIGEN